MNILNEVLFDKENSEYSAFIIDASKKIEKWLKQMNAFETFLENIEPIARKELGRVRCFKTCKFRSTEIR